jgi:DNA (cytosine-5)-methyltransferase 1
VISYGKPTHLDLFSGIGGFSIAAESIGFKTIGFSEIDPYASAILRKHWPEVTNYGDVRTITKDAIASVDLITGGFPCQPFSVAGKKLGDSDARFLWPELVRILSEIRPTFALFENVSNLLAIDGGRTFNRILSDISSLGYDCIWNLVPASAVGANHQRDRVWIVAYSNEPRKQTSIDGIARKNDPNTANTRIEEVCQRAESSVQHDSNATSERLQGSIKADCSERQKSYDKLLHGCSREWLRNWIEVAAELCGVAHGIPNRVDRLRCLGNGIVPQLAAVFLKEIYNELNQ